MAKHCIINNVLQIQALPKLQLLEIINFGDCLLKCGGASAIANALKNGHERLKVCLLFMEITSVLILSIS